MTRPTFAAAAGIGVAITLGFIGFGCSSSTPSSGTGGATGTGGAVTGTGGKGTGGTTGTGGGMDAGPTLPMCASPAPGDGTACNSDPSCTKNCGLNTSTLVTGRAMKACTCSGAAGTWSWPASTFRPRFPLARARAATAAPTPAARSSSRAPRAACRPTARCAATFAVRRPRTRIWTAATTPRWATACASTACTSAPASTNGRRSSSRLKISTPHTAVPNA